ncbi:hypothetical protein H6G96_32670 [Nostoc sp. FACHB-892]|uniref:hypothetical protein n=1 Tax=Nostoc sp. FACHB-892 TaxID=2692843 RepID=UPI001689D84F|nr:hypothetical protein [Nostoc sp. FACHB-892]
MKSAPLRSKIRIASAVVSKLGSPAVINGIKAHCWRSPGTSRSCRCGGFENDQILVMSVFNRLRSQ